MSAFQPRKQDLKSKKVSSSQPSKSTQPHTQVVKKVSSLQASESAGVSSRESYTRTVTTTATVSKIARSPQSQRKKLVFGWIQDVSGSMAGNRIEASLKGFDHVFENVCQPTDFMGVVTYNGDLNTLHLPMPVSKIDRARDKANILKGLGGNTAYDRMYDAVGASILGLQAMAKDKQYAAVTQDAVYQLLLLTDGGDNYSSKFTLETLTELVAHPGLPDFHLVVVAVSMSEHDKNKLRGLCAPVHAKFLDVKDLSELQRTLQKVGEVVQQRLVMTTTTTVTETVVRGGGHSVQAITEGIAATRLCLPTQSTGLKSKALNPKVSSTVCQHFLAGKCNFGHKCRNYHPPI